MELRSFSAAAKALYLTQPTVSAHVSSLEKELSAVLIIRTTKEVSVSERGRVLYGYARPILQLRDEAKAAFETQAEVAGNITVASNAAAAGYLLPALINRFRLTRASDDFTVKTMKDEDVARSVLSGESQLGFTSVPGENPKLTCHGMMRDALVVITPPTESFAAMTTRTLSRDFFRAHTLLSLPRGSAEWLAAQQYLRARGLEMQDLKKTQFCDSNEELKLAVRRGEGVAVVSRFAAYDYIYFGFVHSIEPRMVAEQQLYMLSRKGRALPESARSFIRAARSFADGGTNKGK